MRFSGFPLLLPTLVASSTIVLAVACSVYDPSLVQATGGAGSAASTVTGTSTGPGAGGEAPGCMLPTDCPGMDTACGTRTCNGGVCGVDAKAMGTTIADMKAKDCKKSICDGGGDSTTAADPTDLPNDNNQCTDDICNVDEPKFTNKVDGFACTQMGGKFCKAGACVACIVGTDCPSGVCTNQNTCGNASCTDGIKNPNETDKDCGGACSKCANGLHCIIPGDCVSNLCTNTVCMPSCTDGSQNQNETGVDCGGVCGPCAVGMGCDTGIDCVSGVCSGVTCGEYQLLISEGRFHGPGGGTDDFVEIYNAAAERAILSTDITIATKTLGGAAFSTKWTGSGQTLPPHGHYLAAGNGYTGATMPDSKNSVAMGGLVADKASAVVRRGMSPLDTLCITCGTGSFDATYFCEGTPINLVGCTSSATDRSMERRPGGALGNGTDTNDNTADFTLISPPNPQSLASAPTP